MYSDEKIYQIIIAMLKKWNIKQCVLSAGSRNVPFVHSIEEDDFFICYSVVDERSAGYFAMGIAQELHEPVVISCTSSTATCNYWPAVAEAYYQNVPIIVLTSDRDPAMLHQWEDQMIDQVGMYDRHVKKSVNLPLIQSETDIYFAERLLNEALIELYKNELGPIHINVPSRNYCFFFNTRSLPIVKKIDYMNIEQEDLWKEKVDELLSSQRILLVCGQSSFVSERLLYDINRFESRYNVCVVKEHMANIECNNIINVSVCFDVRYMNTKEFEKYLPDIVISFGGNIMAGIKEFLRRYSGRVSHWSISPNGSINDMFKNLTTVFECSPEYFFEYFNKYAEDYSNDYKYHKLIQSLADSVKYPEFNYSNIYAIKNIVERIPSGSNLHLSINNSIRIANFFKINPGVKVYANIGTHGIDGCLSSFLGQAAVSRSKKNFLVIGDLSFFYDMSAVRIRHIFENVHILLINNHGGEEFYYNGVWQNENSDLHTAARHSTVAREWVESLGFDYISASNKKEFDDQIERFINGTGIRPTLMEIFTEMKDDAEKIFEFYNLSRPVDKKAEIISKGKKELKALLGAETIDKLNRRKLK